MINESIKTNSEVTQTIAFTDEDFQSHFNCISYVLEDFKIFRLYFLCSQSEVEIWKIIKESNGTPRGENDHA